MCPSFTAKRIVATAIVTLLACCSKAQPPSPEEVIRILENRTDFMPLGAEPRVWRIADSLGVDGFLYEGMSGWLLGDDGAAISQEQGERLCESGCSRVSFHISPGGTATPLVTATVTRVPSKVGRAAVLVSSRGYRIRLRHNGT